MCDKETAMNFFELISTQMKELGLENRPECIFNCDETGFMASPGNKKIFCSRKDRHIPVIVNDNTYKSFTVNVRAKFYSKIKKILKINFF